MFRNHYTTIAAWIIVYISLWLSRDNLVSSKFSKNNCHTGFVSRIIETMIFPFQWYKNRPTYEYVVGLVLLCCISVVAVIKCLIDIFKHSVPNRYIIKYLDIAAFNRSVCCYLYEFDKKCCCPVSMQRSPAIIIHFKR